ncbi:MAG: hypothetical protein JXB46_07160 [Candidatus Eisenbacteria bacterium]|nr:hypothetical protein [Candidatus Eisenbacteria bacterium]
MLSTVATLTQAFDRMEAVELTAVSFLFALRLGPITRTGATALEDIDRQSGLV